MPLETLESYDISAERGFLCGYDAEAVELTGDWVQARDVAMRLPQMLTTGKVRRLLRENLPDLTEADVAALSEVQARAAMVHYSFMVQSYIWGEAETDAVLPACLARPMCALADVLGQQPLRAILNMRRVISISKTAMRPEMIRMLGQAERLS